MWILVLLACSGTLDLGRPTGACGITVLDDALEWAGVEVGTIEVATAVVRNDCAGPVVVDAVVESEGGDFTLVDDSLVLAGWEEGGLDVVFAPTTLGVRDGSLVLEPHGADSPVHVALEGRGTAASPPELEPLWVFFDGSFAVVDGYAVPYLSRGAGAFREVPVRARFTFVEDGVGAGGPPSCSASFTTWEPIEIRPGADGFPAFDLPPGLELEHDCALSGDWPEVEELLGSWDWGMEVVPLDPEMRSLLEDLEPPDWWLANRDFALSGGPRSMALGGSATVDLAWAWAVDEEGNIVDEQGVPLGRIGVPARLTAAEIEATPLTELRAAFALESFGAFEAKLLLE